MTKEENAKYAKALLRERAQCVAEGLNDRVAAIDAELRKIGHAAEKPVRRAERRTS